MQVIAHAQRHWSVSLADVEQVKDVPLLTTPLQGEGGGHEGSVRVSIVRSKGQLPPRANVSYMCT